MRLLLLVLGFVFLATPAPAQDSSERAQIIGQINDYFNELVHLQGEFAQIDASGHRRDGIFYLQRPGRIRFEYFPRGSLTVVANGRWVNVVEAQFPNSVQRYPLEETPLAFLLAGNIDIEKDADIRGLFRENDKILLHLRDNKSSQKGEITLIFDQPVLALRQWIITDPQGRRTLIRLSQLIEGIPLDQRLFTVETPRPFQRGKQ
ncbi:MAG: outer-membrane lipoprotein carrier protein LolA [Hyphomicrobiales bacterium]|nr:outer-membrane lipoprotein carrier protein LolA [Hyphomicrobiales bacterium]MCY4032590.1 outer-membrane lipoprotein carrier protein LolA [Hyphomicrobiales bacterium]MCY4037993.1 outer-membrane lipoprotein carrier protein LolA [Hyphomicrobiales bacterium]